jgi:hypothetical protein
MAWNKHDMGVSTVSDMTADLVAALTDLGVWVRSAAAPSIAETKEFLSVA